MNNTWSFILQLLAKLILPLMAALTPAIKDLITQGIKAWYVKAKETPNPMDDYFVEFLANLLGIELA